MRLWSDRVEGHWWTIAPAARGWLSSPELPVRQDVGIRMVDDRFGPTVLSGTFSDRLDSDSVVILAHGLGGNRQAGYIKHATALLHEAGFATLAMDLRGADRRGGGFYHVAQVEDLRAVCDAAVLRRFKNVFVLGFSMGGHLAIHFAASEGDPRLRGVASLCAPLDLHATQQHLDRPQQFVYRHYVLRGLKQIYAAVARNHDVPTPNAEVQRCRTFYDWDRLVIAPRYGYDSPESFYRAQSAANVIGDLSIDTVMLMARNDPIIPPRLSLPYLAAAPAGKLHVNVMLRGGHMQFPRGQSLGLDVAQSGHVMSQLANYWLRLVG